MVKVTDGTVKDFLRLPCLCHSREQERERHSWLYHYFPVPGVCFPALEGKEVVCKHTAKVAKGMRVSVRK